MLLVAGAAAGVAAIFKAPATGTVFALEVPYQDDLARNMLLPAMVASAAGYLVFVGINGTTPLFPIQGTVDLTMRDLVGAALLGVVAGLGARGFAWLLRRAKALSSGPHPVLLALAAGATVAVLYVIGRIATGESLVVGPGYEVIVWASQPGRSLWILVTVLGLRCLATSATVAGGGVGGLFIPLVVAGALAGATIGGVVNRGDLQLFIVVGVAAFLGAGYRVPLAAVMFVAETTGRASFIVPALLAAVAAELVMGHSSVTTYQRTAAPAAAERRRRVDAHRPTTEAPAPRGVPPAAPAGGRRSGASANAARPATGSIAARKPRTSRARCGLATTWRTSPSRYRPVTTGDSGDPDPPAMALAISSTVTGRPLAMFNGTVVRLRARSAASTLARATSWTWTKSRVWPPSSKTSGGRPAARRLRNRLATPA